MATPSRPLSSPTTSTTSPERFLRLGPPRPLRLSLAVPLRLTASGARGRCASRAGSRRVRTCEGLSGSCGDHREARVSAAHSLGSHGVGYIAEAHLAGWVSCCCSSCAHRRARCDLRSSVPHPCSRRSPPQFAARSPPLRHVRRLPREAGEFKGSSAAPYGIPSPCMPTRSAEQGYVTQVRHVI